MLHSLALASSRLTHETGNAIEDGAFAKNAYVTGVAFLSGGCSEWSVPVATFRQFLLKSSPKHLASIFNIYGCHSSRSRQGIDTVRHVYNTSPSPEGCRFHDAAVITRNAEERGPMKPKSGPDLEDQETTISQLGIRLVSPCFSFLVCKISDKHV